MICYLGNSVRILQENPYKRPIIRQPLLLRDYSKELPYAQSRALLHLCHKTSFIWAAIFDGPEKVQCIVYRVMMLLILAASKLILSIRLKSLESGLIINSGPWKGKGNLYQDKTSSATQTTERLVLPETQWLQPLIPSKGVDLKAPVSHFSGLGEKAGAAAGHKELISTDHYRKHGSAVAMRTVAWNKK